MHSIARISFCSAILLVLTHGFQPFNCNCLHHHHHHQLKLKQKQYNASTQTQRMASPLSDADTDDAEHDLPCQTSRRDLFQNLITSGMVVATALTASSSPAKAVTGYLPDMTGGFVKPKGLGGLPKKIRSVGQIMDELQRDLMQERWDLVEKYPDQLRSYVPVFTTFTDSAFSTDQPTDQGLRVALRYEVGRFFASVERMKQATNRHALNEAYVAYSDMALHFDRYLHVGGLYTYYDATITNEDYFKDISRDALVYSDPRRDPPDVRDLVVLTRGPDMGKTGIVIGIYPDGSNKCVVKFDRFMGLREVRVVQRDWVGKRLGEQDPDDVFLIPRKNEKIVKSA